MKKIFVILPITIVLITGLFNNVSAHDDGDLEFFHPVKITKDKPLNLTDCISLAYQNSPKIKRQKYNLDIAKSNLNIAKSGYFPVITAGVGFYNENNSDNVYYNKHYRDLPSVGIGINKLIWDFGKTTANIRMEEFYKIGAEYEFMDSLCSTLFDVKWKYYKLLKAKALLDISKENLRITENYLNKTLKRSPDKETSLVYVTRANIILKESENNYKNAKLDLDNSLYLTKTEDYTISDTDTFSYDINSVNKTFKEHSFPFKREDAPNIAYKNSPDLHVLIATKKAMIQSLNYIKRSYLPELSTNVGYGYNNSNFTSNNSLQVGVNLNSSVNLMELKHSIKGADANVNLAQNEIDLFKKDLYYNILRAFNNFDKASSQLPLAQQKISDAEIALEITEKQYNSGDIDYLSLHCAREDYIQALTTYAESLYNYNTALIQIEMAMHCHITDIHHKSGHAVHHHSEELISDLIKALECTQENKTKRKSLLFNKKDLSVEDDENL